MPNFQKKFPKHLFEVNFKMNILLSTATGYPSPDTGGPNKIIFFLLRELLKRKINAGYISKHFEFTGEKEGGIRAGLLNKTRNKLFLNSRFYRSSVTHPRYLEWHYKKLREYFNSKKSFSAKYDCINFHDVLSGFHLRDLGKKKILTIHSAGSIIRELSEAIKSQSKIRNRLFNSIGKMEAAAFEDASYITFPSIAAKNMMLEDLGKPDSEKIKIINNGIDLEEIDQINRSVKIFDKYGISQTHTSYLFNAANHVKNKNIDKIILAAELLVRKYNLDLCVVNAGMGPQGLYLKKMVHKFGLQKNVHFLGTIPNRDVIRLMKICDFFIMTSERVVFDMVILEALASKTVVLASYDGGNKEIIKDGINGYFLYDNEPEEIAHRILNADRSVINGAAETIKNFSVSSMAEKYLELYQN